MPMASSSSPNLRSKHTVVATSATTSSSTPIIPANVLTYRFNGDDHTMVYVTPGEDYEQALDYAYSVYPELLKDVPRDRIQFSVNVKDSRSSRIAAMAWTAVVASLARFEILDITLRKEVFPPQYNSDSTGECYANEKTGSHLHAPHDSRSTPSPTPNKKSPGLGWIGKMM